MSEYQYYEFQAIDKPLSEKDREVLRITRILRCTNGHQEQYDYIDAP